MDRHRVSYASPRESLFIIYESSRRRNISGIFRACYMTQDTITLNTEHCIFM